MLVAVNPVTPTMIYAFMKNKTIDVKMDLECNLRCQSCPPKIWPEHPENSEHGAHLESKLLYMWQGSEWVRWPDTVTSDSSTCTDKGTRTLDEAEQSREHNPVEQPKRKQRPCQGKRLRFYRFLGKLKADIDANPLAFKVEEVSWLPSLEVDEERKAKTIQELNEYQQQVLRERGLGSSTLVQSEAS